ncbi:protein CgeB [Metabacillus sediminilitoris]|uniref:Protein CgeB n=2 Tax=Metabacillus sediminilitoris TaxID=2567941 RepID=A0A4S4BVC9_9BACI|nr:glycosyltransferase [Metabacillus sediminilitoris]THF78944.1 protein CgeB [Metabacillus sediminilitoris]
MMKILLITSSYKGIYDHFEAWIVSELKKKYNVKLFQIHAGLPALQSLVKSFNPEAALTLVGFKFPIQMLQWLKKQQVKTVVWFTEDPYFMNRTEGLSGYYDIVFTIDSAALEFYKNKGHKHAHHLPLAAAPEVFRPKQVEAKYRSDICLVGYPYPDRVKYIQLLLQNTAYKIQVVGKWKNPLFRFQNNPKLKILEGWVEPAIAANYYNGAKIVLNTHRPFNLRHNQNRLGIEGKSINNRTFDVAACGAFQLIEFKEDLPNHFIEDEEIVSFESYQELVKKIDYYMQFEEERQRIANNARNRALEEHTFEHRIEKMIDIIKDSTL